MPKNSAKYARQGKSQVFKTNLITTRLEHKSNAASKYIQETKGIKSIKDIKVQENPKSPQYPKFPKYPQCPKC